MGLDASSEVYVICQGFYAKHNVKLRKPKLEEEKPQFTAKGGNF